MYMCIYSNISYHIIMNLIGPCTSNPCQNGGVCKVNGTSFVCNCKNGWKANTCGKTGKH